MPKVVKSLFRVMGTCFALRGDVLNCVKTEEVGEVLLLVCLMFIVDHAG